MKEIINANEKPEVCKECGGMCCKKCGCDYAFDDFESPKFLYLKEKLETENISIVSAFNPVSTKNGMRNDPILYLRARNQGKGPVDLFSFKTTCANLTDTGCSLSKDDRPYGGRNLIPDKNGCHPENDPLDILRTWFPHQDVLKRLVKYFTKKTVAEIWQENTCDVFVKMLLQDYRGIADVEIYDMESIFFQLKICYPEAYEKALDRISYMPFSNIKR